MASIDRADWHYGGDFPKDLPPENAGTHIGMFLAWVVARDLASRSLKEDAGPLLQDLLGRKITGRTLLFKAFDQKFFDALLTKIGRDFVRDYYETNAYIADYDAALGGELPSTYHVADTWANYDKIAAVLDGRFEKWLQGEKPPVPSFPGQAAQEEAQQRFFALVSEAAKHLQSHPRKALDLIERFIAAEPDAKARASAEKELKIIRAKYLKG